MTLETGQSLGPYQVVGPIGAGGMGEVYRATDTKLRREVAIKVLPAAFTENAERLARFEREAQLLAQLHHPNISSIFGLEDAGGVRALVMELVEGPTLAERLAEGALPLDGGAPRPLPGSGPNDYPIEWSPDGRDLYLFDPSALPTRVFKVDVASGRRELWREILPIDRVGVSGIQRVAVTPDGSAYAYSYQQVRSNLYLVKGLR